MIERINTEVVIINHMFSLFFAYDDVAILPNI